MKRLVFADDLDWITIWVFVQVEEYRIFEMAEDCQSEYRWAL